MTNHCEICGATPCDARKDCVGLSQLACPKCGASRSKWQREVEVDRSLPADARGLARRNRDYSAEWERRRKSRDQVKAANDRVNATFTAKAERDLPRKCKVIENDKSVSKKMAAEYAWQASHEKRIMAMIRLGQRPQGTDDGRCGHGHDGAWTPIDLKRIREQENRIHPRADLVEAARSGNKKAMARATELFGDTWTVVRKEMVG